MTTLVPFGEAVGRWLKAAGVDAIYGEPWPGLPVISTPGDVAPVLAAAHRRVWRARALAHLGDGRFVADPGLPNPEPLVIEPDAWPDAGASTVVGTAGVTVVGDPGEPVADVRPATQTAVPAWVEPSEGLVDRLRQAEAPVVLCGPGVVDAGAAGDLRALAAAASVGVLNTWGAKGVFPWQSRHHLATAGLQADDFRLGGLADADLVIATGVDAREAPPALLPDTPSVTVEPATLWSLSERWFRPRTDIPMPPLRSRLAAVTQSGWAGSSAPLAPTRVTRHYGEALGNRGLVAADPGLAGYWVARTFSTTALGTVHVPAEAERDGFAAACVIVARLRQPLRPALAVVDGPPSSTTDRLCELAASMGIAVPVEVWREDGDRLDADAHHQRTVEITTSHDSELVTIATHPGQLEAMIDVAGPIVAWRQRAGGS